MIENIIENHGDNELEIIFGIKLNLSLINY